MSDGDVPPLAPSATVSYEFRDSSVPPPFHRSFVLVFDHTSARIVVDSYGEVLADRSVSMPPEAWNLVADGFPALQELVLADPEPGCTGGTGFAATVAEDGAVRLSVQGLACGGVNSDAADRLAEWVRPVRVLFPPMEVLAPE